MENADVSHQDSQHYCCNWPLNSCGNYPDTGGDWIELSPQLDDQQSVHGKRIDHGGFNFVGYQFTLPFMGGVHEKSEEKIRVDLERLSPLLDSDTILVTHGPAYGILDRGILDRHAGSVALAEMISGCSFRVHIHGHIHREFGRQDRHFNVASAQKRRAMLIDVVSMEHEVLEGHGLTNE